MWGSSSGGCRSRRGGAVLYRLVTTSARPALRSLLRTRHCEIPHHGAFLTSSSRITRTAGTDDVAPRLQRNFRACVISRLYYTDRYTATVTVQDWLSGPATELLSNPCCDLTDRVIGFRDPPSGMFATSTETRAMRRWSERTLPPGRSAHSPTLGRGRRRHTDATPRGRHSCFPRTPVRPKARGAGT
jgi:hypothetical protein